jgi:undecaprenyl-diphosphatase
MFDIGAVTLWLQQNPEWIIFGLCSAAFIESFALIGIIIPGVILLAAISGLAASTNLSIFQVVLLVYISSCLADISSFFIGKYLSRKIDHTWPFKKNPSWLEQGRVFFKSYGILGVFLGRFIGPVRPLIPITAGSLAMDMRTFILVDLASGLLWAPLYSLPGYFAGKTALEGSGTLSLAAGLIAIAIAFLFFVRYLVRKK